MLMQSDSRKPGLETTIFRNLGISEDEQVFMTLQTIIATCVQYDTWAWVACVRAKTRSRHQGDFRELRPVEPLSKQDKAKIPSFAHYKNQDGFE